MGYTTKFEGTLEFTRTLNAPELALIQSMFQIDTRDAKEMKNFINTKGADGYIQFEFTQDFSGIQWDNSEKFYNAVEAVNFIIENTRTHFPDFGLKGKLRAQGEEIGDCWLLAIGEDGWAKKLDVPMVGQIVTCPHCDENFILEEK